MYSPWSNYLPSEEYTAKPSVVYYLEGSHWVPVAFLDFTFALALYKKARAEGERIFIFPANCHPLKPGWKGDLFSPAVPLLVVSTNGSHSKQSV